MNYKGFSVEVEFSTDDDVFVGKLLGVDDVVSFKGKTIDELKKEFHGAVDSHLEVHKKKRLEKLSGKR